MPTLLQRAVTESVEHLRLRMGWVADEPMSLASRRALIARGEKEWSEGRDVHLGVFLGGRLAGGGGLHRRCGPGALEIGYWTHPAFLRPGVAAAVARLLTHAALEVPGITRMEIHHDKSNSATAGVPRRLGSRFVGEEPDEISAPAEVGIDLTRRRNGSQVVVTADHASRANADEPQLTPSLGRGSRSVGGGCERPQLDDERERTVTVLIVDEGECGATADRVPDDVWVSYAVA
jgi:ribosomal-protein-serine acetyltransferase